MKFTEHDRVSAQIAQWSRAWLPDNVFFTVIAHGARHAAIAAKLRQIGTEAGVPDILLIHDGRAHTMEIKTGSGTLRTAQRDTRDRLMLAGATVGVVHSLDDFIGICAALKIPLLHHPRRDEMDDDLPI